MFHRCRTFCPSLRVAPRADRLRRRAGLTLLELLIATSIMVIIAGTLGGLAKAVQLSSEYSDGHAAATQHGRVCLERITRIANEATANESFPGFLVLAEEVASWRFPDTLVVWHPDGSPIDPEGLPRFSELVIFTPGRTRPGRLLEITVPSDSRQVPSIDDLAGWASEIEAIKTSANGRKTPLTNLLRTAVVPEATGFMERAAVRFESRLRPSADEWSQYQAAGLAWDRLSWVQGIYGSQTGLRQAWLRIELQLMPGTTAASGDPGGQQAIPFLGSAALYYEMHR